MAIAPSERSAHLEQFVVTAKQMRAIESRVFQAGMPVAALMEKVAGLITQRLLEQWPDRTTGFGIIVGPGHNGGDALVVARELHFRGYGVKVLCPLLSKLKDLTDSHAHYAVSLGIPFVAATDDLADCDVLLDGLFGFGLTRSLTNDLAALVNTINQWSIPVISIDIASGLHTDTGEVLGTAVRASQTLCLGLWKRAFLQEVALDWLGEAELVDFGLPLADIQAVIGEPQEVRITDQAMIAALPLPRAANTHKYKQGHLLVIAGSQQYPGAAIMTALAARASGVGMLTVAVPATLQPLVSAQVPDALVLRLPENDAGVMTHLPDAVDGSRYTAIAFGPGVTPNAVDVARRVMESDRPLVIDADGLNILASDLGLDGLANRSDPAILTPHLGEFRRLFPDIDAGDRIEQVRTAAQRCGAIVLLKGARVAIADPQSGHVWLNPSSTSALARGGSGDILTGLLGGLLAQGTLRGTSPTTITQNAVWWHAQAGRYAARDRTELGVDAITLANTLIPALQWKLALP
ncbi:NAD(P)H-hydrate dehydratase [Vacuolonema iberomarrocanum]|uniref:NAD(P)H-hydrate dehydratase n=1 Tax=Vacuolonema iberomarrocanum TaxID=3454632 RepID=UPI0019FCD5C3|nr:NAD(P)H-hydrate dehydratase [filamentous cyanobacterium LEGE 07170]